MELQVDHVTVVGSDLDRLTDAFTAAGFRVAYRGQHPNDVTQMSLLGFRDDS